MKSTQKVFLLLLTGALALAMLAACGGDNAPAAPAKENAPQDQTGSAETAPEPGIEIYNAWSRPTPDMVTTGIVYMTIKNNGSQADRLIAAKTPASKVVELHDTDIDDNGVMRMRMVKGGYIEVLPGGEASLEPAGMHVMLIDLTEPLQVDTTFPLTLKFEKAGELSIDVPVVLSAPEGMQEMATKFEDTMYAMELSDADPIAAGASQQAETTGEKSTEAAATSTEQPTATPKPPAADPAATLTAMAESVEPIVQFPPRAAEDLKGGLFINMTTDDIDRAAMAVGFATKVMNNTGKPVTIFFNTQGVRLVDTHIPQNTHKSGKTIQQMIQKFMDDGGVALVCPVCMKNVGGLAEGEILPGVIIGTPEYTWSAMFAQDVTVLSY